MNYTVDWSRKSTNHGYVLVFAPDHPRAWSTGYFYEHIVIMEKSIGRLIDRTEHVHHKNEDRSDNRLQNLELLNASSHVGHHNSAKAHGDVELTCRMCGITFMRTYRNRPENRGIKHAYCSKQCSGKGRWVKP